MPSIVLSFVDISLLPRGKRKSPGATGPSEHAPGYNFVLYLSSHIVQMVVYINTLNFQLLAPHL